jgi:phospholipase/carboxylesterase
VFIAHGERDQVIEVRFAREAAARLRAAGIEVDYHESPAAHHIDPRLIPLAGSWVRGRLEAVQRGS